MSDIPLSERETAVLALLSAGKSNTEIAGELGIGYPAVQSCIAGIYKRVPDDVDNRMKLGRWFLGQQVAA